jgi:hypothetical protein
MNQIGARLILDNARKYVSENNRSAKKAVLTQSFLRFEVALAVGQTTYKFDTLVNENTQATNFNTQTKLNLQDAFICAELGFFITVASSTTDVAFKLYTYPNVTIFTSANVANYHAIYNGSANLTVNQQTILTNWDLSRHYYVPAEQQNVIEATYASTAAPAILRANDQLNLSQDGFYPMEPNIVLSGSSKNDFQVQLPGSGIPTAVTSNSRLVCIMRGILAQNITSVK